MTRTLRVLHVEDSERDMALLTRHLARAGYDLRSERVETREAMMAALTNQEWDVILCDYLMPQFSALRALELLKETGLDIPFIIISGTVGEATAVEAMRAGANDYLMKDNLARLAPTIEREMHEAENRRARRQVESELRKSEARYRRLLDTSYEGVWVFDAELRTTYVNQRLAEMLGVGVEEMIGRSAFDFMDDAARAEVEQRWERRAQGLKEQYDLRLRRRDDSELWTIACATPICGERGEFVGALSMLTDITKRKRAEEALRESEERYRLLFENNPHPMWVYDVETLRFIAVNEAAVRHYGYSREEFLTMTIKDIRPPEDVPALLESLATISEGLDESGIWKHRKKDGGVIDVEITSHTLNFAGRHARVVLANDVTERKVLEEQLRQSQKMEAVGQLAGGVAHDFNNLLTAITGYSELTMRRLKEGDPLRHNVEEIKRAGERAAALTRQLLAFSRKQVMQPVVLSINAVVSEMEKMLRRLIGEDVEFRTALAPDLGSVKADPGQIEQVLMNLAVNSRDAMPGGGKLTIETANVYLDEEYAGRHVGVTPGPYVMLAVSDTGTGMDAETRAHIFEPFFTTKEIGKGTGLGLSTVYGIVRQSGGHIWVYSEVGRGTTFKVYLPRVDEGAREYRRSASPEEAARGTETILLAEDDDMVRRLAREVLEMYGYRVLEAANGGAALLICEHHAGPIDLLVTDAIMPEMSGRELSERLSRVRPDMKVLYMSGYADTAIVHQGTLDEGANFLQKPFTPDALTRKVRELLDAPPAGD